MFEKSRTIQLLIRRRRTKEGEEIDHDLCGKLDGAHYMVHSLISIITLTDRKPAKPVDTSRQNGTDQKPQAAQRATLHPV
jgi:hypothetical protein